MSSIRVVLSAAAMSVVIALAGCAGPPLSREGATADPLALTSLWGNGPGGVGADVLDAIVASEESPEITVEAPPDDTRAQVEDYEGATIELLRAGESDLSVLRADRLAMAGAASLAPLTSPATVQGPEHAAAIAADLDLSVALMADLDALDLVGIALAPGGTRRLFGYGEALLSPDDLAGTVINTRVGTGVDEIFTALGAGTEHSTGEERTERAASGASRGIEVSLQQSGAADLPAVITTDLDPYTKFDVVVITRFAWGAMTVAQREALTRKAQDGVATAVSERLSDADALAQWCGIPGASSATASAVQHAAMTAALQSVRADIAARPGMSVLFDAIDALAPATKPASLASCAVSRADAEFRMEPVGDQGVLDGTWRLQIDLDPLLAAGMPRSEALGNVGVWTIAIRDGRGETDQPQGEDCAWQFAIDGDRFSLDYEAEGNTACYGLSAGTFRVDGDRATFDFDVARDNPPEWDDAIFARGMVRIADE